jgi:HPr kinase/phosphorylase
MEREYSYKLKTLVEGQKLNIIYPSTDYEKVLIKTGDVHRPGLQLAGFYDYFDPPAFSL